MALASRICRSFATETVSKTTQRTVKVRDFALSFGFVGLPLLKVFANRGLI
jgi:hypothetical protein